jgi:hypothetical protein
MIPASGPESRAKHRDGAFALRSAKPFPVSGSNERLDYWERRRPAGFPQELASFARLKKVSRQPFGETGGTPNAE